MYGDLTAAPETVMVTAGFDMFHDSGIVFAEGLRKGGARVTTLDYPALCHGFAVMTGISKASAEAVDELIRVTSERLYADRA